MTAIYSYSLLDSSVQLTPVLAYDENDLSKFEDPARAAVFEANVIGPCTWFCLSTFVG